MSPRKSIHRRLTVAAVALSAVLLSVLPQVASLTAPSAGTSDTSTTTVVRAGDSAWSAIHD
ncbi:hypothetical protein [Streptomyces sp. NPDC005423]|uniref:hypothetical protein n=1 Tax=Streptomyces sp. NPDC005423 TaxID=3155343 RepID=UPI0033B4D873